jgi:hypothetical protein
MGVFMQYYDKVKEQSDKSNNFILALVNIIIN